MSKKLKSKRRTSIWLEDDLRAQLDRKARAAKRSLAFTITDTLRKGLARSTMKDAPDDAAPIFG